MATEDAGDLTGRLVAGRYRVTGQLGKGGMGVVWRATDEVLGREVAVKVLRTYTDASEAELAELRTRMQREARAAARIRHSGVITVFDVAEEDGRPVVVMELVDGPSLEDVVKERGALAPREAAEIGTRVMSALAAAHRAGVLHRDVKPGNILLDHDGRVVLTDFGIAGIAAPDDGAATNLTRTGQLVGSLDFLPPERAQGLEPGPAADIWSLGLTLYAVVEGKSPFHRSSVFSTLTAIVDEPLPPPLRSGPLAAVLAALTHKDPAQRPTAARAQELLAAVTTAPEESATPTPAPTPATAASVPPPAATPMPASTPAPSADPPTAPPADPPRLRPAAQQPYIPASLGSRWEPQAPPPQALHRGRTLLVALASAAVLAGGAVAYILTSGPGTPTGPPRQGSSVPSVRASVPGTPSASSGTPSARPSHSPSPTHRSGGSPVAKPTPTHRVQPPPPATDAGLFGGTDSGSTAGTGGSDAGSIAGTDQGTTGSTTTGGSDSGVIAGADGGSTSGGSSGMIGGQTAR